MKHASNAVSILLLFVLYSLPVRSLLTILLLCSHMTIKVLKCMPFPSSCVSVCSHVNSFFIKDAWSFSTGIAMFYRYWQLYKNMWDVKILCRWNVYLDRYWCVNKDCRRDWNVVFTEFSASVMKFCLIN